MCMRCREVGAATAAENDGEVVLELIGQDYK